MTEVLHLMEKQHKNKKLKSKTKKTYKTKNVTIEYIRSLHVF